MKHKISVLIVDDDRHLGETLTDILIEKGYETNYADNGFKGLEELGKKSYEVVLLDLKMPDIDGLETFRRIKKVSPESLVIAMTAFSLDNIIDSIIHEGVSEVLYKPLDIDNLLATIITATGGSLIMIVDDDPNICQSLAAFLSEENYLVSIAKDSNEALKIAKKIPQHILLIDMKLPVLNGLETYLALKKINPNVKAIMMTGYREETKDLVKEAMEKDAHMCIYKPFEPSSLLSLIKEIA